MAPKGVSQDRQRDRAVTIELPAPSRPKRSITTPKKDPIAGPISKSRMAEVSCVTGSAWAECQPGADLALNGVGADLHLGDVIAPARVAARQPFHQRHKTHLIKPQLN